VKDKADGKNSDGISMKIVIKFISNSNIGVLLIGDEE